VDENGGGGGRSKAKRIVEFQEQVTLSQNKHIRARKTINEIRGQMNLPQTKAAGLTPAA
jgi:hypothetical protein